MRRKIKKKKKKKAFLLKCARKFCYKGVGARKRAQLIKKEEKDEKKSNQQDNDSRAKTKRKP